MIGTTRPWTLAMFLWITVVTTAAGAETVYVAERFEIGVHDNTNIDSAIVAVIPSGTPLAVIDKDGEFVEVSTPDGIRGWVDARYVVNDKPSVALLDERDAKLQDTVRSLGAARAEIEVLRQRVTELQRDATTAAHRSPGITKSVSLATKEDTAKLKDAERELVWTGKRRGANLDSVAVAVVRLDPVTGLRHRRVRGRLGITKTSWRLSRLSPVARSRPILNP
jgi:SH3 domain protein